MPGYTDKSEGYLRLADENCKRAAATENPKLKATFLDMASKYRNLAQQLDVKWLAKLMGAGRTEK